MSESWDLQTLVRPISDEHPCGEDVEYTLLPEFDAFRVFGRSGPYEQAPDEKTQERPQPPPDWNRIQIRAGEVLQKSKDLRVLAHLGAAALRTGGVLAFSNVLSGAAAWLERHWAETFPRVEEGDVVFRRNALNYFADPIACVDGLRRAPLVASRQHGTVSLRDIEIAAGTQAPASGEAGIDQSRVDAAFGAMSAEDLDRLAASVTAGLAALSQMDALMREKGGTEDAPEFEPILGQFSRLAKIVGGQQLTRKAASNATAGDDGAGESGTAGAPSVIRSRQDAVRSLEAVAEFFRRTEPSSPVPLFLDRAKRLVSKDFLEVLADVAPDALPQARAAGGVKNE